MQQTTRVGYYITPTPRTCLTLVSMLPSYSRLHASLPINLSSWDTPRRTADDILSTGIVVTLEKYAIGLKTLNSTSICLRPWRQ